MDLIKLSIGIPAHNEEANIKNLLDSIRDQVEDGFVIEQIIVASDGSTDKTAQIVRSISDPRIILLQSLGRKGKAFQQNSIFSKASGDIILLFDADIILPSSNVIFRLIQPLLNDPQVGLVSVDMLPLPSINFFQKVLNASVVFKKQLFEALNGGDNLFLCHGRGRAFSKMFAERIKWPAIFSEDAYSYLFCKFQGFKFVYLSDAAVLFRSPGNFSDHKKQSDRFRGGVREISKYLPAKFVRASYKVPFGLMFAHSFKSFLAHPVLFAAYMSIVALTLLLGRRAFNQNYLWPISESSKILEKSTQ